MRVTRKLVAPTLVALAVLLMLTQTGFATQQTSEKVFWMITAEVPADKLVEYHTLSASENMPLFAEHGYNWVVSWQTIIGEIEEVVAVAEFENIAAYHQARVSLMGSPEYAELMTRMGPLLRSVKTRLLSATPYSPLH